ncbi:MAG: GHKL domain-containing protein [Roseburia sp.]|nr:GHKL domain-containing protein [Roseburia sp.]
MSEWYANAIQWVNYGFEGLCMVMLCKKFLVPKIGDGFWRQGMAGLVWIAVRFVGSLLESGNDGVVLAGKSLAGWGIMLLFFLLFYQGETVFKLFVAAVFFALREMSFFAAYSLLGVGSWFMGALVRAYEGGMMGEETLLAAVSGVGGASLFLEFLAELALLFAGVRFLAGIFQKGYRKMGNRELLFCMLPAEAGLLVGLVLRMTMFLREEGGIVILYQKYPALYGIVPVISLALYGSILFNFWLYQRVCEQREREVEQELLQNQIVQMQGAMQEMERLYDGIRSVRHDMKNQMLALQGILPKDGGGREEFQEFLADMYHCVEQLDYGLHTGNSVCDAVIGSKFAKAKSQLSPISLSAENFLVAKDFGVRAYDLGIMLNNGLDNALEAIERMRKVYPGKEACILVRSFVRGGMFFIEVENSFCGSLRFGEDGALPLSQKEGEGHGIGLRNIRNCARKYGGEADCIVEGERFILSIMLKGR